MNYAIVLRLNSLILASLAVAFAFSLGVAWLHIDEPGEHLALSGFAFSLGITALLALGFFLLGRKGTPKLFRKEALTVIGTGWLLASLVGALPYLLILPQVSLADALFESASGLTTTGASILSDLDRIPHSLHFWRGLSQWMGGLGVVVFFVALLSFLGAGAKVLFSRESSAQAADLNTSRVQQGVIQLLYLYVALSTVCCLAYWIGGMIPFDAVIHTFTTMGTGGFSNRNLSFAEFGSPLLEWMAVIFMMLGGTSFPVMLHFIRHDRLALWKSTEVRAYYAIAVVATLVITVVLWFDPAHNFSFFRYLRDAAFQVASIMTTTGFASADFDQWLPITHMILLALMVVGGCSGSTSGGTKVIRFVIAVKVCVLQIEKSYRARVVRPLRVNGKCIGEEEQHTVLIYMVMLGLVFFCGMVVVSFLEPSMSFEGTVSATAASLFNIGPGFAEVGPMRNFADLHEYTKLFLAFLMILGRLELFAILALFSPSLWRRY